MNLPKSKFTRKLQLTELAFDCLVRLLKRLLHVERNYLESMKTDNRSLSRLWTSKWRKSSSVREKIRVALVNYFQRLPNDYKDELLARFTRYESGVNVWHIMPLLYESQTRLRLDFRSAEFDMMAFLKICSEKFRHLTYLKLPRFCYLTGHMCDKMRLFMPLLNCLDLNQVTFSDDVMPSLAKMQLEELILTNTRLTNESLSELWNYEARIKMTLKIIRIANTLISLEGYIEALQKLPKLVECDCTCSLMLAVPKEFIIAYMHLTTLTLKDHYSNIEKALQKTAIALPTLTNITICTDSYSPKLLNTLTYQGNLRHLSFVNGEELRNFQFSNCLHSRFKTLLEFSVHDFHNIWFGPENDSQIFTILAMCPVLEKLSFSVCEGLSNQVAVMMARLLKRSNLKCLSFHNCCNLEHIGLVYFFEIPSLVQCAITLNTTLGDQRSQEIKSLEKEAERNNVELKVTYYT